MSPLDWLVSMLLADKLSTTRASFVDATRNYFPSRPTVIVLVVDLVLTPAAR
jgi:hypothetical protein